MLNLSDSLIVSSSLCPFVLLVCSGGCAGFIAWSVWVEDPHIKIGCMKVVSKEPIGFHDESCTVLSNSCAVHVTATMNTIIYIVQNRLEIRNWATVYALKL